MGRLLVATVLSAIVFACDPGYSVYVRNETGRDYFVGSTTEGIYRVDSNSTGVGPGGLGERSEPIFLFDADCHVVEAFGRLGNGEYLVVIAPDGSATISPIDAAERPEGNRFESLGSRCPLTNSP